MTAWLRALPGRTLAALRNPASLAIILVGLAWGLTIHNLGWAQTAHFAQVQALAEGKAEIDEWHWQTGDKAWIDGHFYSVKSPGIPLMSIPAYLLFRELGGVEWAHRASERTFQATEDRWNYTPYPPFESYGYDYNNAQQATAAWRFNTPLIWTLTLLCVVIPAVALLFGVRRLADRMVPGYGAAAAITLGICTIVMTFGSEYFSHVISAALAFGAFVLLQRERQGSPNLWLVAAAGLLAGLAFTFEYQVALVSAIVGLYAIARQGWFRRGLAYGGAAIVGTLPAFAFNWWALGSPTRFAYADAVSVLGRSGHDQLGLNDPGFFGITVPNLGTAFELMFSYRGLLTLTPIVIMGVVGIVLLWRDRERRADAWLIGGVVCAYFLYNSGYWLPFGGGSPGPRFLIPALPFLAVATAAAWRRYGALTLTLAVPSAFCMVVIAITYPLIGEIGPDQWVQRAIDGMFEHTAFLLIGVNSNILAILPVIGLVIGAAWLAARATPPIPIGNRLPKLSAVVVGWFVIAVAGSTLAEDDEPFLHSGNYDAIWLPAAAACLTLTVLAIVRRREILAERRSDAATGDAAADQPTLRGAPGTSPTGEVAPAPSSPPRS